MKTSVVIRGSDAGYTQKVIDSIRTWFDEEIILSSWLGHNTSYLKGLNKVILNEDPGPGPAFDVKGKHVQNTYRQLVAGFEGIKTCSGDVVLVIRSDTTMTQNPFCYFDQEKFSKSTNSFKIFSKKIVIGNMMSINPSKEIESVNERSFRVGDWFHIGQKEDMQKYFGVFDEIPNEPNYKHIGVEQNWLGAAIKKYYKKDLDLKNLDKYNEFAWDIILNNFRIINNYSTAKSFCLKPDWINQPENLPTYLSQEEYEKKYKETFNIYE